MRLKSMLLGSAAALVTTGSASAQAADVMMEEEMEPVEYVRVCDAYGSGFFYIPGSETCLRFDGYARYQINANEDQFSKSYRFRLNVDARSDTEWGTLRGFGRIQGNGGPDSSDGNVAIDQLVIQLGGFHAGYTESAFVAPWGGLGIARFGPLHTDGGGSYAYQQRNQIGYTWAGADGWSATIALEDDNHGESVAIPRTPRNGRQRAEDARVAQEAANQANQGYLSAQQALLVQRAVADDLLRQQEDVRGTLAEVDAFRQAHDALVSAYEADSGAAQARANDAQAEAATAQAEAAVAQDVLNAARATLAAAEDAAVAAEGLEDAAVADAQAGVADARALVAAATVTRDHTAAAEQAAEAALRAAETAATSAATRASAASSAQTAAEELRDMAVNARLTIEMSVDAQAAATAADTAFNTAQTTQSSAASADATADTELATAQGVRDTRVTDFEAAELALAELIAADPDDPGRGAAEEDVRLAGNALAEALVNLRGANTEKSRTARRLSTANTALASAETALEMALADAREAQLAANAVRGDVVDTEAEAELVAAAEMAAMAAVEATALAVAAREEADRREQIRDDESMAAADALAASMAAEIASMQVLEAAQQTQAAAAARVAAAQAEADAARVAATAAQAEADAARVAATAEQSAELAAEQIADDAAARVVQAEAVQAGIEADLAAAQEALAAAQADLADADADLATAQAAVEEAETALQAALDAEANLIAAQQAESEAEELAAAAAAAEAAAEAEKGDGFVPDITGVIGFSQAWGGLYAKGGFDESESEGTVTAGIQINIPSVPGSSFRAAGFYSSGPNDYSPGAPVTGEDTEWSVAASYRHQFTPAFSGALGGQFFQDFDGDNSFLIQSAVVWVPIPDQLDIRLEGAYEDHDAAGDDWSGFLRFQRYF